MIKKNFTFGILCLSLACLSVSMSEAKSSTKMMKNETGVMVGGASMVPSKNIVQNAIGSKDHTTLVTAVKAGGLVETLSSPGPFTVFAPTNEAFAKLPSGTVDSLLEADNKGKLVKILTYHVVPGSIRAKDLQDGETLKTVEGKTLKVTKVGNKIKINGAAISISDVISSNGVTHVIDNVLLP